ncbi:hypothetical protein IIZ77_00950, partial [Candidatus Saccharibacteria bacterium]|nr:hypothetical protein [Candidatus Saccharibacteria bacterium]
SNIPASTDFIKKLLTYFKNNTTLTDLQANERAANQTSIVRDTNNTITITGNIINNQINSQVIIIGKNINIDSNVTRIDAWLIATDDDIHGGTIDTCADVADNDLSNSICTNQLTINGQLYGGQVKFKRTFGGDPATNSTVTSTQTSLIDPAETINYTPSTFVWGSYQATGESNPRIVYIRQLPARF